MNLISIVFFQFRRFLSFNMTTIYTILLLDQQRQFISKRDYLFKILREIGFFSNKIKGPHNVKLLFKVVGDFVFLGSGKNVIAIINFCSVFGCHSNIKRLSVDTWHILMCREKLAGDLLFYLKFTFFNDMYVYLYSGVLIKNKSLSKRLLSS